MSADLPTIDYLDELVDTDPAQLLTETIALRARAERAEAAIARARELAADWATLPPGTYRRAGIRILAALDVATPEEQPDVQQIRRQAASEKPLPSGSGGVNNCDGCSTVLGAGKTAEQARDGLRHVPGIKLALPGGRDLCPDCAKRGGVD